MPLSPVYLLMIYVKYEEQNFVHLHIHTHMYAKSTHKFCFLLENFLNTAFLALDKKVISSKISK